MTRTYSWNCPNGWSTSALPYYLHQLDAVKGSRHFHVPVDKGLELIAALHRRLPGYAVPRYVQEIPAEAHKIDLASRFFPIDENPGPKTEK